MSSAARCRRRACTPPEAFLKKNPNTSQALANAMVRALKWIQKAGPADIVKVVPESFLLGDRALYIEAFQKCARRFRPTA